VYASRMAARRKKAKKQTDGDRIRHLLALDASNVMRRLRARQDEMVSLFSRLRDREPLLGTIRTWFPTITLAELNALEPQHQRAVNAFYELLDDLRWYLQYTQDMPRQVALTIQAFITRLETSYGELVVEIGAPHEAGGPVVDAEVVRPAAGGERPSRR